MSKKPLSQQTIFITGASSGIGRTTAEMAAEQGAHVFLCSRSPQALSELVEQIEQRGGQADSIVADVADERAMREAALEAERQAGGIDTWINNAGVSIYGLIEEVPQEEARRMFDTNYWGMVNGSLAAVPILEKRGGTLINIGSVLSEMSMPLQGHYSASKHAVMGFTNALRMELEKRDAGIDVCLVKPSAINTTYAQHARNHMDEEATLPPPVYAPEVVARAILRLATHPQRDVTIGGGGKTMTTMANLAPRLMDKIVEATQFSLQKKDTPANGRSHGALTQSVDASPEMDAKRHGDVETPVLSSSLYTWTAQHPQATAAAAAAAIAGGAAWLLLRKD